MLAAMVWAWLNVIPTGTMPRLFDLDSYRATLNAVADGALMFDWLGYPPVSLILLSPLRGLPELAGDQLWTGTSLLMFLGLAAALAKLAMGSSWVSEPVSGEPVSGEPVSGRRDPARFLTAFGLAAALLLVSLPATNQLVSGQLQLTVITLAFLDAAGVLPRKWQGTLVGLAAAFKLTPLIFLPFYLITRQWRQAGLAASTFAAATGVGFALFPRDSLYFWTHAESSGRLGVDRTDNLSILGTLSRWMADPGQARMVWLAVAFAVGLAAFWRAREHFGRGEQVEAALVIGCASTAISPIAWPHYQVWLVLAAVWLVLSGERFMMIIGALMYVPYCPLFALLITNAVASGDQGQVVIPRALWELTVLVPVLICVLGLPHRVGSDTLSGSGRATGESSTPRVLEAGAG